VSGAGSKKKWARHTPGEGEGRRERGVHPLLRCKHGTLLDVHVLAYAHSSLTTPLSASAVALPPPLHTISIFDSFRTQCGAHCTVRGAVFGRRGGRAERGRRTRTPCKHAWEHHACPLLPLAAPTSATKTPQRTNLAPQSARGAQDGSPAGTWRLKAGALFGKPRPPLWRVETALFNPHSLMLQLNSFTWVWLVQKRPIALGRVQTTYLSSLARCLIYEAAAVPPTECFAVW